MEILYEPVAVKYKKNVSSYRTPQFRDKPLEKSEKADESTKICQEPFDFIKRFNAKSRFSTKSKYPDKTNPIL